MSPKVPPFGRQWEKLMLALKLLDNATPDTQVESLRGAIVYCTEAFKHADIERIPKDDADAQKWIDCIRRTICLEDVRNPDGLGTAYHRAKSLTAEERQAFREAVAKLLDWCTIRYDEMI